MKNELELIPKNLNSLSERNYFLIRARGDSMINAGIKSGDYLLVDRKYGNTMNSIIIAEINGKWTVKTYLEDTTGSYLLPQNPKYKPIPITENDSFKVIGKVIKVIKSFN